MKHDFTPSQPTVYAFEILETNANGDLTFTGVPTHDGYVGHQSLDGHARYVAQQGRIPEEKESYFNDTPMPVTARLGQQTLATAEIDVK